MEIVFISNELGSNFGYMSNVIGSKTIMSEYEILSKEPTYEIVASKKFNSKDIVFEKTIVADLYVNYPLKVVVKSEIKFGTLHELISEIRNVYHEIYKKERETMTRIYKSNKNLINRGSSDGEFGIWGHDIYDLCISYIEIYENSDKPIVYATIES